MLTIGTHMSIAKGIAKTAENVVEMKANTMQIFSRNPRGSNYKTYTKEEIGRFPVSYTHLDVYKRQLLCWADILQDLMRALQKE